MNYEPHPLRFRLSRKKGYRKPENGIVVSRPSRWGNPFVVDEITTIPSSWLCIWSGSEEMVKVTPYCTEQAVALYRLHLLHDIAEPAFVAMLEELRGKRLGCWCALNRPCHADVLAELANR